MDIKRFNEHGNIEECLQRTFMVETPHLTFVLVTAVGVHTFMAAALASEETSHSLRSEIRKKYRR
jgi:hypothetical protein